MGRRDRRLAILVVAVSLFVGAEFFSFLFVRFILRSNWEPVYLAWSQHETPVGWPAPGLDDTRLS